MTLLDHRGNPVSSASFKKGPSPRTGSPFTTLYGPGAEGRVMMPAGGSVQFNLDNLTVRDFRAMISHYQVNASLAVLSFMQHQSDWHIECEGPDSKSALGKRVAEECEQQLRDIWTPLNRSLSTANWAGYSGNILEWENSDVRGGKVVLDKIKDLIPEAIEPHWKLKDAWIPNSNVDPAHRVTPKIKIYDGIDQVGSPHPVPVDNTLWYPLLMENGNYWGRKLLKAAFQSWYFSILIHLFANRYYERFGEPLVKGRAPFDSQVNLSDGQSMTGLEYMSYVIRDLRSRSAVTLPDDRTEYGSGTPTFDYDLSYLESQMRGADFQSYLTRLDEEISIGLFTPILLLRTADVGSYNLGVGHMQMYLWMLNAMNDDRAQYINKYILRKIANVNFGLKSPTPKIKFRKLGNQNADQVNAVLTWVLQKNAAKFDLRELGEIVGMNIEEIEGMQEKVPEDPADNPDGQDENDDGGDPEKPRTGGDATQKPRATTKEITARVRKQVENAFAKNNKLDAGDIALGYDRKMQYAMMGAGVDSPITATRDFFTGMTSWIEEAAPLATSSDEFMGQFEKVIKYEVGQFVG